MISFVTNGLCAASATLRISGPDANTFLNGQFTQELRVSPGQFAYGLWLNQKGKVLADSFVLRETPDEHLVFSPRSSAEILRRRLEDYLIADEVEVSDESANWVAVALWGPGAREFVAGIGLIVLSAGAQDFGRSGETRTFPARLARESRFWLLLPRAEFATWRERLSLAGGREVTAAEAERERIAAGIPAVPDDIGPGELPNEGGLERDAISYTKGCYLGQEVMSRLKNLGQVRRQLHVVRGTGEPPPRLAPLFQGDRKIGEVRSAAREPAGFVALALLSLVNLDRTRGFSREAGAPETISLDRHG